MFGLFKKRISPNEFGQVLMHYTTDFFIADCSRSLGSAFSDFDGSVRSDHFFESRGMPIQIQKNYFHYFSHGTIQKACLTFDQSDRQAVVAGAMSLFKRPPPSYDVFKTFSVFEAALRDERPYSAWLSDAFSSSCGLVASEFGKCMLDMWPCPEELRGTYVANFSQVCSPIEAATGTVQRACEQIGKEFKPTFEVRF